MFPVEAGSRDPNSRIIPFLPGKIFLGRSQTREVALQRMRGIDRYCKELVKLPPAIAMCKHVLDFFESWQDDLNALQEE